MSDTWQDVQADFNERAAILEYDNGLTRNEAEAQAVRERQLTSFRRGPNAKPASLPSLPVLIVVECILIWRKCWLHSDLKRYVPRPGASAPWSLMMASLPPGRP